MSDQSLTNSSPNNTMMMLATSSPGAPSASFSTNGVEICARNLLDVTFKYTWTIENYIKYLDNEINIDSPVFEINVNGLFTKWSLSVRYWRYEGDGIRVFNPVVLCLNLVSSRSEKPEELQVCYQFGIWNDLVKQYEVCPIAQSKIELNGPGALSKPLTSISHLDIWILDQHLIQNKNIEIFCKIVLIRSKVEENTLVLDLCSKLRSREYCDVLLKSTEGDGIPAHKMILSCRSTALANMIKTREGLRKTRIGGGSSGSNSMNMMILTLPICTQLLSSLLQYIYTDRLDPMDTLKAKLQLLKLAVQYELPGLKDLCEKALIDCITPTSVPNLITFADTFDCKTLKRAAFSYCNENGRGIVKSVAWKVMETIYPELFEELLQTIR